MAYNILEQKVFVLCNDGVLARKKSEISFYGFS